jgi:hypothetical protein
MTHEDSAHYAAKHPAGATVSSNIRHAVADTLSKGTITCTAAHEIAASLKVSPKEVGMAIDLQEGRIVKCQLGLFGYDLDKKKVKPAENIDPVVQKAIEKSLIDGRLACADTWRLAQEHGMPRLAMANVCESLGIKIKPCQLGAF